VKSILLQQVYTEDLVDFQGVYDTFQKNCLATSTPIVWTWNQWLAAGNGGTPGGATQPNTATTPVTVSGDPTTLIASPSSVRLHQRMDLRRNSLLHPRAPTRRLKSKQAEI
jgi:hypothetical protein